MTECNVARGGQSIGYCQPKINTNIKKKKIQVAIIQQFQMVKVTVRVWSVFVSSPAGNLVSSVPFRHHIFNISLIYAFRNTEC